jgi:hypothetical protein
MTNDTSTSSRTFTVTDHAEQREADRRRWLSHTPEERLAVVERLRIEAGRFLHEHPEHPEYPSRLRRLLTIAGRTTR